MEENVYISPADIKYKQVSTSCQFLYFVVFLACSQEVHKYKLLYRDIKIALIDVTNNL